MKIFYIILILFPFFSKAQSAGGIIKTDTNPKNILIIMFGESNSGGLAANSDATATELGDRPLVQLWNNANDTGFYDLQVSVNSLIGHSGLEYAVGTNHGWDLQLGNRVYSKSFSNTDTVYLVKAGEGGSHIADWCSSCTYWTTWKRRVHDAINIINTKGKPLYIYVMYSQGINDEGIGGPSWYTSTLDLINRTITEVGNVIFCMTYLPTVNFDAITLNQQISKLASNYSFIKPINTYDCPLISGNMHWNYTGMKKICDRMLAYILNDYNKR